MPMASVDGCATRSQRAGRHHETRRPRPRPTGGIAGPALETDGDRIDALDTATADALFSAKTLSGAHGSTLDGLPYDRVRPLLAR